MIGFLTSPPDFGSATPDFGVDAQCPAEQGCAVLNAAQMFAMADRLLASGDIGRATRILSALTTNRSSEIRAEAYFRRGRLKEEGGDLEGAARDYAAILAEKPGAGAVRLALARVLAALGAKRSARLQVRQAQRSGLPSDMARAVDRFDELLKSQQRLGGTVAIGVAIDSNINHATTRSTVYIADLPFVLTPDARRQSGIGLYGAGQAYWRPQLTSNLNILATLSGVANVFGKSRFNDMSGSAAFGPELVWSELRLYFAGKFGERSFGSRVYSRSYGGGFTALIGSGPKAQVQVSAQASYFTFPSVHEQDGLQLSTSLSYERRVSPHLAVRIVGEAAHNQARADPYSTWTLGGSVVVSRQVGPGFAYFSAGGSRLVGAGPFSFPPETRRDRLWQMEGGFQFGPIIRKSITPALRLKYVENRSPVFFYDFTQARIELTFSSDL